MDFPTTPGVIQEHPGKRHCIEGCTDAFVSKIAPSGSALVYSTYLYGEVDDAGNAIAVDGSGNAYVMGTTNSGLFPILHAFQHVDRGLDDAFVVKLNPDATRLVYSSYLGGSRSGSSPSTGSDRGTDIVLDEAGNAYVAGYTLSFDLPTTPDAFQPHLGGGVCDYFGGACGDTFLAKISAGGPGVTTTIRLTVNPADAAPGGTIVATWAGNPTPTASDYLRLFALGSAGDEFDDPLIYWPTPNAAAGELPLPLPADLPVGWYELRLLSPAPGSSLPVPIARSEPIRITASTTTSTTTTTQPTTTTTTTTASTTTTTSSTAHPTTTSTSTTTHAPTTTTLQAMALCEIVGASVCDDGDPCTVDSCVPRRGCVSTPASGFASVTCTCGRVGPVACADQLLPASIGPRKERVCSLFDDAAGTTDRTLALRRLRRAVRTLKGSITIVSKARKNGISRDCAGALKGELRDAKDRAERLLGTLGKPRG